LDIFFQEKVGYTIQFSPRRTPRFDVRGLSQRRTLVRMSGLAARYTVHCNYLSARPELLSSIRHWSQVKKNHTLMNVCSFKPARITWYYQVRSSYSSQNVRLQIILVNVVTERMCYVFNHSKSAERIQNNRSDSQMLKGNCWKSCLYLSLLCVMTSSSLQTVTKTPIVQNKRVNMCANIWWGVLVWNGQANQLLFVIYRKRLNSSWHYRLMSETHKQTC
jgi:hypothetical protein